MSSPFFDPLQTTFVLPYDSSELVIASRDLELAVLKATSGRRRMQSEEQDAAETFGRTLFESLVHDQVAEIYHGSKDRAADQGAGLCCAAT